MEVNGNLNFNGVGKLLRPGLVATDFPANPSLGELVLKDKKLYMCVDVTQDGLPLWVNLVNELSMFRYDQYVPAMEWTFDHTLNTNINVVQVYDQAGNQVIPDNINCAELNRCVISFNMPISGVAILTSGDTFGLPRPNVAFTEDFSSSTTWVVTHNLGYNPNITVIIDNYVAQPLSIAHDSVMQATITFSSAQAGSVRCV